MSSTYKEGWTWESSLVSVRQIISIEFIEANSSSSSLRPFEVKLLMLQCAMERCLGGQVDAEDEDVGNMGVGMLDES